MGKDVTTTATAAIKLTLIELIAVSLSFLQGTNLIRRSS